MIVPKYDFDFPILQGNERYKPDPFPRRFELLQKRRRNREGVHPRSLLGDQGVILPGCVEYSPRGRQRKSELLAVDWMLPLVSVPELLQGNIGPFAVIENESLPAPGSPLSHALTV